MVKLYHKLVRDKIPEILAAQGKTCVTEVLDDGAYLAMLKEKLAEECTEVRAAGTEDEVLEELADVLEVVYAIGAAYGWGKAGLEEIRQKKKTERGAFAARILLKEVGE